MKGKIAFLVLLILAVTAFIHYFLLVTKPLCEPCLKGTYCPPCVNPNQKSIIVVGAIVILLIIFKIIKLAYKRIKPHEHNQPT
jgi:hypothetical protein